MFHMFLLNEGYSSKDYLREGERLLVLDPSPTYQYKKKPCKMYHHS